MTNLLLFISSIFSTCIHYIGFFKYNPNYPFLEYFYIFGIITSILNHGLSHNFFKILDRTIITILFFVNIYFFRKIYVLSKNKYLIENAFFIMILSVCMFFLSKILDIEKNKKIKYIPHALAHIIVTISNLIVMKEYSKINKN